MFGYSREILFLHLILYYEICLVNNITVMKSNNRTYSCDTQWQAEVNYSPQSHLALTLETVIYGVSSVKGLLTYAHGGLTVMSGNLIDVELNPQIMNIMMAKGSST